MTPGAANAMASVVPSPEGVANAVRRGCGLDGSAPVVLSEIQEFSNINYVYRAEIPERTIFVKVAPERGKRFPAALPQRRIFSEAEGLRRFRDLAGGAVVIPEALFVDEQEMALGMSDVGEGRQVLFSVLGERFDLLSEQAEALGQALGAIHGATRGAGSIRPAMEEMMIRKIIFDGLLAPGARTAFPDLWESVSAEMQAHKECLIHSDLWSKNHLVKKGAPVALVDFEGVNYGDPAFDLGTLIAAALIPALEWPALAAEALDFTVRLLREWSWACGSEDWFHQVLPRTFRATGCFLAARGFGPFAYPLRNRGRERIGGLARKLATEAPADVDAFHAMVMTDAGPAIRVD